MELIKDLLNDIKNDFEKEFDTTNIKKEFLEDSQLIIDRIFNALEIAINKDFEKHIHNVTTTVGNAVKQGYKAGLIASKHTITNK